MSNTYKTILLIMSINLIGCKSTSTENSKITNKDVYLRITNFKMSGDSSFDEAAEPENNYRSNSDIVLVGETDIDLELEVTNDSKESIFILKANKNGHALPSYFNVIMDPEITQCVIMQSNIKPESYILEIKPNTKSRIVYEDASFGACEDIKGETFECKVVYEFSSSDPEIMNNLKRLYADKPEAYEKMKQLTDLKLISNEFQIQVPN